MFRVGVITAVGVGKLVKVGVGGNQTLVGVGVSVAGMAVFVGKGGGVCTGAQDTTNTIRRKITHPCGKCFMTHSLL